MIDLATRYTAGVQSVIDEHDLPWSVTQLGARAEYRFTKPAPRNGTASWRATDDDLDDYLHLFLVNRGVLLTPFHNMALMCPVTTAGDVDVILDVLAAAVRTLVAA
jgi:glutamate-1-semialdehyde 2,1-aminomutase